MRRQHANMGPYYYCSKCDFKTIWSVCAVEVHMQRAHGGEGIDELRRNQYRRSKHGRLDPADVSATTYTCEHCHDGPFTTSKQRSTHIRKHHPLLYHSCVAGEHYYFQPILKLKRS
jgi:hypothetical protein